MSKIKPVFVALLAVSAFLLPGAVSTPQANAASPIVIRFASLAPAGSGFMKVMKAWNRSLKAGTENRVEFRFYGGGSQGDERDFIRKIRAGQMDAAGVSTTGIGLVVRAVQYRFGWCRRGFDSDARKADTPARCEPGCVHEEYPGV